MRKKVGPHPPEIIAARIFERIHKHPNGCWVWLGAKSAVGYGQIWAGRVDGKPKTVMVHRAAYEARNGPIPVGLFVCHRCDNPSCVNHDHLFLAPQKGNLADMTEKGRRSRGPEHAEKIKRGWTPEKRARRAKQTEERMRRVHEQKCREAGVPIDWKYCKMCDSWHPRENFHKNAARHDGLNSRCRKCHVRTTINRRIS